MKARAYLLYSAIVLVFIIAFSLPMLISRSVNGVIRRSDLVIPDTGAGSATPTHTLENMLALDAASPTFITATLAPTITNTTVPSATVFFTLTFSPTSTPSITPTATPSRTLIIPYPTRTRRNPKLSSATPPPLPEPPPTSNPLPTDPPATQPPVPVTNR